MSRLAGVALPVAAALLASGAVLLAVGVDPLAYYGIVVRHGLLTPLGLAESAIRSAPLLLLAASLMVSFSAGLWNLGGDGQFLLAAVAVSAICPPLDALAGPWVALPAGLLVSLVAGGLWAALPAFLRAWRGVNEIITTLMMSFLGASLANALIKLVFLDPETTVPRTRLLPVADRLPRLFGGTVHLGVPLAVLVLVGVQLALARTAWGLRLRALGASRRAAGHAGIDIPTDELRGAGGQRRAGGAGGRSGYPRRLGRGAGGLESGVRTQRRGAGLPGAAERLGGGGAGAAVRGALGRWRERHHPARRAEFVLAGVRGADAAVPGAVGGAGPGAEAGMSPDLATELVAGAVTAAVPLLLAGIGEQLSEKAGVLNVGIEGMMLAGAFAGFTGVVRTGALWPGFLFGAAAGMAVALPMVALSAAG